MTKIAAVEARTVRIPLDAPTGFSSRLVHDRFYTLVRVTGDDGVAGIGFCYPGHAAGSLVTTAVRELLAPVYVGQDAYRVEGLWEAAYQESLLHGRAGSVVRALSAIDIALWDRNARAVDLPLHRFLGGAAEGVVDAYASGGYYLEGKGPEGVAAEMRSHVEAGFGAVKMKIGRLDPHEDEQRLAAVREAVGPDVMVMLDANNAWRDLPTALRSMALWEPHDPYWIEEPFSPDDIDNHAALAERTPVLVATGEIEAGRWRHKELLDKRAAAILQTDAAVCGGITEYRRIAATASSYGVTMCPHWFHDLHVHLVASTPNARYVEFFVDDAVLNFRKLVDTDLRSRDGQLLLPEGPGLGFSLLDDEVERFAVDAWS
jgi:L-alanine-DL-glutamate epimerase-like enolase superfamily enzyme